jgi:CRP/FNR family transcriptional regulator, cyclic AMP receptor protein
MRKVLFIFGQLTDGDVEWLAKHGKRRRVAKSTVLINEGVPVESLYIVLEGELAVLQGKAKKEIARLGSGEMAGEMSFVDARPPSATVTAHDDAVVYTIPRRTLADALEKNPGFGARFYKSVATFLSDRLRNATDASYDDELDDSVLDNVDRAGARFNMLARHVQEG